MFLLTYYYGGLKNADKLYISLWDMPHISQAEKMDYVNKVLFSQMNFIIILNWIV